MANVFRVVHFTAVVAAMFAAQVAAKEPVGGDSAKLELPKPFATTDAIHFPKVLGWSAGKMPNAPKGFKVTLFADRLDSPRWIYVLPSGDVLVAESRTEKKADNANEKGKSSPPAKSPNRITLFRDNNGDGEPDNHSLFLSNLHQPLGMALVGKKFFVGNTDALMSYDYEPGGDTIRGEGTKLLDLPKGGYNNHWTRNVVANSDGTKLYISVGSGTNVDEEHADEKDSRRAAVLECDLDAKNMRVFASGLRNPVGLAFEPRTNMLWAAVNERDGLGDDLVPDYFTSVQENGFYGWPYSYFGQNVDPRKKGERDDLVAKAIVPDYPLGAHTASLGLAFYEGASFPKKYRGGAFIGQHGSWNRAEFSGYRVAFVSFKDGKPTGTCEDFLTGFIANDKDVYGRPVGVAVDKTGALLVADDGGNCVWRVAAE